MIETPICDVLITDEITNKNDIFLLSYKVGSTVQNPITPEGTYHIIFVNVGDTSTVVGNCVLKVNAIEVQTFNPAGNLMDPGEEFSFQWTYDKTTVPPFP